MAVIPPQGGKLDITVAKGATYSLPITDTNVVPYDFTGKTWSAIVRTAGDNTPVFTGAFNVIDSTHATIDFTATQTILLSVTNPTVKYELSIKHTVGLVVTPFSLGMVTVLEL